MEWKVMLFNHEDIEALFFIGFQDVEELEYRSKLGARMDKILEE